MSKFKDIKFNKSLSLLGFGRTVPGKVSPVGGELHIRLTFDI